MRTERGGVQGGVRGDGPWRVLATWAAVWLLLACPAGTAAQAIGPEEPSESVTASLEVALVGGVVTPLADLTSDPNSFGTVMTVSGGVGAEATVWFARSLGVAVQGLFAPGDLELTATDFQGAVPADLGKAHLVTGTVSVLYRIPVDAALGLRPYLGVGAGLRRLTVDPIAAPEVEDATDPVATLAAGAAFDLTRRVYFRAELRDHIARFEAPSTGESTLQNDLAVTLGLGARVR